MKSATFCALYKFGQIIEYLQGFLEKIAENNREIPVVSPTTKFPFFSRREVAALEFKT